MYKLYVDGKLCAEFASFADAIHMAKRKTCSPNKVIVGRRPDGSEFYRAELV